MVATTWSSTTRRRRSAILAALACVLTVPVVLSHAQTATCGASGQFRVVNNVWTEIKAPTFPVGGATVTAFAMAPANPDLIYATNGVAVVRSGDGGCVWDQVLTLTESGNGDVSLSSVTTRITSIMIPEQRSAASHVYLTAVQAGQGVGRPFVLYSDSGTRNTFGLRSSGLPAVGSPTELASAISNANVMYIALRSVPGLPVGVPTIPGTPVQTRTSGALYRSTDGGSNWTRASDGNDFDGAAAIDDIAVDTSAANTLWTVAGGELRVSRDSGATHTLPGNLNASRQASYTFTAVDVKARRVVAFSSRGSSGASALVSTDGGNSFAERRAPATVASTAHDQQSGSLIIGTLSNGIADIFSYRINGEWSRVTPVSSSTDWDVKVDQIANDIYAMRPSALYKTVVPSGNPPPPPPPGTPPGGVGTVPPVVATITPSRVEISLPPGGSATRDFVITLPPSPTKLDIFFVMDNSKSMLNLIEGVKANLASVLQDLVSKEKIDVFAGLSYYGTTEQPPLYERLADIQSPNTGAVYTAFDKLDAKNTGQSEPVLLALYQAATGEGFDKTFGLPFSACAVKEVPQFNRALCGIPKDQDASWRAQSLRVFVHATNEKFIRNLKDVDDRAEHSFEETGRTLRARDIQHVGIVAGQEAEDDLTEMSRLAGTLAPVDVDCDGNGTTDVRAGSPIVCPPGENLAKTLVAVLKSVRDVQPVGLFSRSKSPVFRGFQLANSSAAPASLAQFSAVNVKQVNTLRYRATFSCAGVAPSTTPYEVKLSAQLRGETLRGADATALVTCGALVAGVPPGVAPNAPGGQPPGPQPQIQPNPPPPAPAPAVPVLQIQPAPQVQVNPQVNPQAGAARQEEKEFQFATATNDLTEQEREGTQLAMSMLTGVALLGAFGTAHALRRREADRLAYNLRRH